MTDHHQSPDESLEEFYDQLEETVISQARRLINNDLYTKAILSTLPLALVATDREGRILSSNRAADELLKLNEHEKNPFLQHCFSKDQLLEESLSRCLKEGAGANLASHHLNVGSDSQSIVNVYLQPLRDEEKEICGALLAIEDQAFISFLQDSVQEHGNTFESRLVAESKPMKHLEGQIKDVPQNSAHIIVCGPSGAGKTYISNKIHRRIYESEKPPFIIVDCKKQTEKNLKEFIFGAGNSFSETTGKIHFRSVKDYGAVHLASGGSLVIKHVDALPMDAQDAVLEFLSVQDSEACVGAHPRLLTTTCVDIAQLAENGKFNQDLAGLLLQNKIDVPPLNKRRKDVLPLAKLFLEETENSEGRSFSKAAENLLLSRAYENNNVAELKEAVALAALVSTGAEILPEYIFTGPKEEDTPFEVEISSLPLVKFAIQDRSLSVLRYFVLLFFSAVALVALLFPGAASGQFANSLAWGLWWPSLIIVFLLLGRLWCTVCPLSKVALLAQKLVHMNRPPPEWMKRTSSFVLPIGFLLILWIEHVFHMISSPTATSLFLGSLMLLAAFFAVIYERETWCRYLCPLGNLGAIYSLPATLNVRANPSVCSTRCTTHECHKGSNEQPGCQVFHHPLYARDSHICKLCFNCLKSCPHDSAKLHLRPPLIRIWQQGEVPASLSLFALTVFFVSPLLLGSKAIPAIGRVPGFSVVILLVLFASLLSTKLLPTLIKESNDHPSMGAPRIALALMVLGWGPLAAFQIANFPSVDSLVLVGTLGPVWSQLIPDGGLPLLKLAQTAFMMFAALFAGVTIWGIYRRSCKNQVDVTIVSWAILLSVFVAYLALNLILVFIA